MALPLSITLEEHFCSQAARQAGPEEDEYRHFPPALEARLDDLEEERLKNMDENGVSIQVMSHTPNALSSEQVIAAGNDELAEAVRRQPKRYAGFAQLPMLDPAAAARELERCVKDFGFLGALVDNHAESNFYDSDAYDVFWAKAEELDVPIYLHPAWPSKAMITALYSGGGLEDKPMIATAIGAFGFGWHSSTATTVLRLLGCGMFDKYPKVKIIIGHMGELLPYMFARIDRGVARMGLKRGFAEVMHSNVWITTSGMFDTNPLRCALGVMPLERVLFSVDYPFSDNKLGRDFLRAIRDEKVLEGEQLEAFASGNAKKLLFTRHS